MTEIAARWVTVYPKIASGFSSEVNSAISKGAAQASKPIGDGLEKGVKAAAPKVGAVFKSVVGPILTLKAVGAIADFVGKSVSAFNAFEDAASAAEVVFGESVSKITAMADAAAESMGIAKTAATEAAITFGTFGKSAGLAGDDLANFSTQMVQLAGDLASFQGKPTEQAIEAIGAALRGESEPIRAFGVLLDDATLRAQALKLGLIETTKEALTPQQRVLAAQAELLAQTTIQQGDYIRTAEQGGNIQKRLAVESANLSVAIGEKLQPAIVSAQKAGIGFLQFVTDNQAAIVPLVAIVGTLTAAIGGFVAISKGIEALKAAKATISGLGDALQAMSTKAKVATASAGAVGLALTAGALIYGNFAQANANAEAAVREFTTAVEADTGALGENTRAAVANQVASQGLTSLAAKMGISSEALTDAVMGNGDALDYVNGKMADYLRLNADNEGAITGAKSDTDQLTGALGTMSGQVQQAKSAYDDYRTSSSGAATATGAVATAVTGGKITFEDYTKAINDTYSAQLKLRGGERAVEAAIDDAAESIKAYRAELVEKYKKQGKSEEVAREMAAADIKAGRALDTNTEAGRRNEEALDGIAQAALQTVAGMSDTDKASGKAATTMDRARAKFIKTAESMGMGSTEARKLATRLGLVKSKDVDVDVKVKWSGDLNKTFKIGSQGTMRVGFAGGGPARGGIPGRDSILSLLTPDEHVLTVDDVKNLGGHEGVFRMRSLAQQGVLRFAAGGPVMPTYKGHSLDWWEDYLLTDLEMTRLQIRIKDLKADLKAKETYNPPGKRKRATRLKLRGLERKEAQLELAEAEEQLKLALDAAKANASASGTLAERIERFEAQQKAAEDAAAVWQQAAATLGKGAGISVGSTFQARRDAAGNVFYESAGFSAADFVKQKSAEGDKVLAFVAKVERLRQMGAPARLLDDILALGYIDGTPVVDAFLADPASIKSAAGAYGKFDSAQGQMEKIGATVGTKAATEINITNNYPQAEPTSVTVNKALFYASAVGSR